MPDTLRTQLEGVSADLRAAISSMPADPVPTPVPTPVPVPVPVPVPPLPSSGAVNPALCGLTIPEASLKPMSALPALYDGIVVEGFRLTPQFTVSTRNVTLRNCLIQGPSTSSAGVRSTASGLRLEQCEARGGFHSAVAFENYTAWRCNVHHFSDDGFKLGTGSHIIECWVHDATPSAGAHADGVQQQNLIGSPGASVVRCHIDMGATLGNAALFLCPSLGGTGGGDVLIEDNYLAGGNYTLQVRDGGHGLYHQLTYRVHGNTLKAGAWRYGAVVKADPVAEWANNKLTTGALI